MPQVHPTQLSALVTFVAKTEAFAGPMPRQVAAPLSAQELPTSGASDGSSSGTSSGNTSNAASANGSQSAIGTAATGMANDERNGRRETRISLVTGRSSRGGTSPGGGRNGGYNGITMPAGLAASDPSAE